MTSDKKKSPQELRSAGEFHWVHVAAFDSRGNLYTGEVDTGKRLQKWVPLE